MKIAVTGGRQYRNKQFIVSVLNMIQPTFMVLGGATGVDSIAQAYAIEHNIDHTVLYAKWEKYKKAAGPKRNAAMLDQGPDLLVAFFGGTGTSNTIDQAASRNIKILNLQKYDFTSDEVCSIIESLCKVDITPL